MRTILMFCALAMAIGPACSRGSRPESAHPDIVVADFEGNDYGGWKADRRGVRRPAPRGGRCPGRWRFPDILGQGLVN